MALAYTFDNENVCLIGVRDGSGSSLFFEEVEWGADG